MIVHHSDGIWIAALLFASAVCLAVFGVIFDWSRKRHGYQPKPGPRPKLPTTGTGVKQKHVRTEIQSGRDRRVVGDSARPSSRRRDVEPMGM